MRFTTFLISGALAAVAVAQSTTTTASAPKTSVESCLDSCPKGDVNCQAHCITVPSPNDQNANDTTECAKKCNQGDGSQAQTEAFGKCVQDCIAKHYYVSSEGTPKATGGSGGSGGSGSGSGSDATATGTGASPTNTGSGSGSQTTGSGSGTGTQTGSGAAASKTGAAAGLTVGSSGAFIGALAALLAL